MFFSENSNSFRCFQSDREFIPDPRRSDRESMFTQIHERLLCTSLTLQRTCLLDLKRSQFIHIIQHFAYIYNAYIFNKVLLPDLNTCEIYTRVRENVTLFRFISYYNPP